MAQPMPPPPPAAPKSGFSMFTAILILALITCGVAWYNGWFTVEKNPETGKTEVKMHSDKFKSDKDAFLKKAGDTYTSLKDKITGKEAAAKTAKPEDKAAIDKEIEELKKKLASAEETKKQIEAATDDSGLKKLEETVKKLQDK